MKVRTRRYPVLRARARQMRSEDTRAEAYLWEALRAHRLGGWKWRRQSPKGRYIVDFLCDEGALVVEVDGDVHLEQRAYDARRTEFLRDCGLRVMRFWNWEVLEDRERVCLTILGRLGGERAGLKVANACPTDDGVAQAEPPLS